MRCDESGLNVCAKVLKSLDKRNICPACVTDLLSISQGCGDTGFDSIKILDGYGLKGLGILGPVDVKLSSSIQPSRHIIILCSISHKEHLQRTHS